MLQHLGTVINSCSFNLPEFGKSNVVIASVVIRWQWASPAITNDVDVNGGPKSVWHGPPVQKVSPSRGAKWCCVNRTELRGRARSVAILTRSLGHRNLIDTESTYNKLRSSAVVVGPILLNDVRVKRLGNNFFWHLKSRKKKYVKIRVESTAQWSVQDG